MAKFWCWFLGHKWRMPNEWFFKNSNVTYVYYCERCGITAGKFERAQHRVYTDSPLASGIVRAGIKNEDGTTSYLDELRTGNVNR